MTEWLNGTGPQTNYLTDNFSSGSWTANSGLIFTTGLADPLGGTNASILTDSQTTQTGFWQGALTLPQNGNYIFAGWFKQGGQSSSTITAFYQFREAGVATRGQVLITWPSANSPVVSAGIGSLLGSLESWGNGWYRQWCTAPGAIAANNTVMQVDPAGTSTTDTGDMLFFGPCVTNGYEPFRVLQLNMNTNGGKALTFPRDTSGVRAAQARQATGIYPPAFPPVVR